MFNLLPKQRSRWTGLAVLACVLVLPVFAVQKPKEPIPHGQTEPPGPALTPEEAIKKMKVPEGFSVELVASEPDLVNPVAMTIDEKGRFWVTESLEYPRRSEGPGKDRVKILEDTDGDGKVDKVTIFAEGLNIPSGIAVGNGGVYVANSPDILFYKIGADGKADGKPEVIVSGFGRTDTHELPNSLTWGPDGWLYGLNGVFNYSNVKHQGKEFKFTCALFRIHPKTKEFQLFCEGTSNPWGVAFDTEGSAFVSACVIDHLWHLAESGYYHRQGGPYPPFTWKLGSIVKHKHQKAAYCGIHYFDSDAYPPEYRDRLYMGNIHGGCINVDVLQREGSSYAAKTAPDFLTANDAWFMPVVQKTGPDGCLYILDWYDRYHCYQDANRDPQGIDRKNGRLYRVRYKDTPRAEKFDLTKETDDQLIKRLHSPNVFYRDHAQRLLRERNNADSRKKLEALVLDDKEPRKARMHALWSLVGTDSLDAEFHGKLLGHKDASYRAWGVRAAGNYGKNSKAIHDKVVALAADESPDVQLQVAVAARKLDGVDAIGVLLDVLAKCGEDKVIPPVVWQNLHPLLEEQGGTFLKRVEKLDLEKAPNVAGIMSRVIDRLLAVKKVDPATLSGLVKLLSEGKTANRKACGECMGLLATRVQSGELTGEPLTTIRTDLQPTLNKIVTAKRDNPLYEDAAVLSASLGQKAGIDAMHEMLAQKATPDAGRFRALVALIAAKDAKVLGHVETILSEPKKTTSEFRAMVLGGLGRLEEDKVAEVVLLHLSKQEPEVQPRAVDLLTQRTPWARQLLKAIADKKVAASALSVTQVRKLQASKDADLVKQVQAVWGVVREDRNPEREQIVKDMREHLKKTPGDAMRGIQVYKNVCGQCHKLHGEGQEVGPDITSNGRSDYEQLLSNVFDPSLVIGSGYQATTITTKKGQSVTGLLVEDNEQRVVLKLQGGKLETIAVKDIDERFTSKVSMMPEGLEKQIKPQELADLFAYIVLDKPPTDPKAKKIPGTP